MTDLRDAIYAEALTCLGMGGPEPWATEMGIKGALPSTSYCGLGVRAVWRRKGVVIPDWVIGSANLKGLVKTTSPQLADLIQWRGALGHQSLFVRFDGSIVESIDWNTTGKNLEGKLVASTVARKRRPRADVLAYYSAPLASATPRPVPVDSRASTGAGLPAGAVRLGVDVSAYQTPGSVNWLRLRELGYSFAYIRGVRMGRELDVHAVEHVQRARAAGFAVGLYSFFVPTVADEEQVARVIDANAACGMHPGDLAPALDIESHTSAPCSHDWTAPALYILDALRAEYGAALRYHNVADWLALGKPSALEAYPLWLADYAPPADLPCVCWQHKSAIIPGYGSQKLDQNVAMGPLPTIGGRAVPITVEPSTLPDEIAIPWVRWDRAEHDRLRNAAVARKTDRGEYD